jgi:outer membrane protein TolC
VKVILCVVVLVFLLSPLVCSQENIVKLTLDESIEQALKNNLELKISEVQFQEKESDIAKKETSFNLKVDLEGTPANWKGEEINNLNYKPEAEISANLLTKSGTTYSFNVVEEGKGDEGLKETSLSFTINQKILPSPKFSSSYLSWEKALLDLKSSELFLKDRRNSLKFEVKTGFYNILKQRREVELEKLFLEQAKENLTIVEDKLKKGLANELDLLNAQLEVVNVEKTLFQNQNQLRKYLMEFKNLLGIDFHTKVELIEESKYDYEPLKVNLDQLAEEALYNRVEIKQQKLAIEVYQLDLALAKTKSSPSLGLSGGYNYAYNNKGLPDTGEYKVSLVFGIPLLDGGESKAEIQGAKEKLKESQLNLKKIKRDIITEVQEYFFNFQEKQRQIEFLRVSKEKYQEDLNIAQERFLSGLITKHEFREKEISLKQAQIDLFNALLDCEFAKSKLLKSLGRKL